MKKKTKKFKHRSIIDKYLRENDFVYNIAKACRESGDRLISQNLIETWLSEIWKYGKFHVKMRSMCFSDVIDSFVALNHTFYLLVSIAVE